MLRFLTCGESHGPTLFSLLDGVPAGLPIDVEEINNDLWRRQQGYGRGNRQKIERDRAELVGGVRHGITTGAPVGMLIRNRDFENWQHVMSSTPVDSTDPDVKAQIEKKSIATFRPGHADLAGTFKFRQRDIRDVLERASARETASRVAAGAVARIFLNYLGVQIISHVIQVGSVKAKPLALSDKAFLALDKRILESELFCLDDEAAEKMKDLIKEKWQSGDSLGGVVEVIADGLPVGLGSYTQWDKKLDGQLAQAVMSIQAMKAIEIGDGVSAAGWPGSVVHDALYPANEPDGFPFSRQTNRAGGLEGGMTNGERLCLRAYMKPIPTMRNGLASIGFPNFEENRAHYERSDVCAIAAASVVCRAMVSLTLANAVLDKFGGDTVKDIKRSWTEYVQFSKSPDFSLTDTVYGELDDQSAKSTGATILEPAGSEDAAGEF
jgi:chorismate synthase